MITQIQDHSLGSQSLNPQTFCLSYGTYCSGQVVPIPWKLSQATFAQCLKLSLAAVACCWHLHLPGAALKSHFRQQR